MKQKLVVAFSAAVVIVGVAIGIAAHCGSTWVTQAPTLSIKGQRCKRDSGRTLDVGRLLGSSSLIHDDCSPRLQDKCGEAFNSMFAIRKRAGRRNCFSTDEVRSFKSDVSLV